jgi:site-specific DNA-cytosine methylase
MWILPKQLHTSPFVPDTAALISDSTEQSEICAQSLLARSKPSPARTWSQRWKRDSWTQHLSGRILKPSHGPSFVTAWTSCSFGYPCQPFSAAGKRLGAEDPRHLWPFIAAGIAAMRPSVCFAENVEGHISLGLSDVLQDLAGLGYRATWCVASASECGAPHQRKRIFILAYRHGERGQLPDWWREPAEQVPVGYGETWGDDLDNANAMAAGGITGLLGDTQGEEQGEGLQRQRSGHAVGYAGQDPWPSRPGEQQFAWEPPRVVGGLANSAGAGSGSEGGDAVHQGWSPSDAWATSVSQDSERQVGAAIADDQSDGAGEVLGNAATPTGGPESAQRKQELGRTTSGGGDLASQAMTQWGSPRTGIRGDTHFSYDRGKHNIEEQAGASMKGGGKLNPRWVETLMGLPIGWTMPSCIRPVTIAPTSCDSSGTALCQPSQSERSDFFLAS